MSLRLSLALILLVAAGIALRPQAFKKYPAEFVGRYVWDGDKFYFGGFSAVDVSPDGKRFLAIGDNAQIVVGTFLRQNDVMEGLKAGPIGALKDTDGVFLYQRHNGELSDSEGVSWMPDGSFYVSFERDHRVWRYSKLDAAAEELPRHRNFGFHWPNGSFEALATDDAGRVYVLPEIWRFPTTPYPIYRFSEGAWSIPFQIARTDGFRAVGADFGPDGDLYLLERKFLGVLRFVSRVRRIRLGPTQVLADEVILETWAGQHDNLEGIAVWRDETGVIRLTMISDDNYQWFQTTEIVEYRLTD